MFRGMSNRTVPNFFVDVQRGNIVGHSIIHKFGSNTSVPNGTWAIVSPSSPSGAFPTSGTAVRIKAGGNVADTENGLGARAVIVVGLDLTLSEVSETIITSGANISLPTTGNFWRIYRAYVSSVGAYGVANTGDIIIEDSDGINDMLTILTDEGQTQHGVYSIPAGKTGYLLSMHLETDASKAADFRLLVRENFTDVQIPMSPKLLGVYFDGVLGQAGYEPISPSRALNALTDIWVEARGGGANTEVSVDFEILLIDNPVADIKTI